MFFKVHFDKRSGSEADQDAFHHRAVVTGKLFFQPVQQFKLLGRKGVVSEIEAVRNLYAAVASPNGFNQVSCRLKHNTVSRRRRRSVALMVPPPFRCSLCSMVKG